MKFNLIYFYTSSCQFKEQQQSSHLCLISSIRCRWSRECGSWTEAEHVARSQPPQAPAPPPQGPPSREGSGGFCREQRGTAPGHSGRTCHQRGEPSSPSPRHTSPPDFFFFNNLINSLIFWLCWVFVSVQGLSPVAASGGHSSSRCAGLSLSRPLLLWGTGSRRAGSVIVAHGPSCSAACGIFPDQGSNPCPLYWQADSQPLRHQGSPPPDFSRYFCQW